MFLLLKKKLKNTGYAIMDLIPQMLVCSSQSLPLHSAKDMMVVAVPGVGRASAVPAGVASTHDATPARNFPKSQQHFANMTNAQNFATAKLQTAFQGPQRGLQFAIALLQKTEKGAHKLICIKQYIRYPIKHTLMTIMLFRTVQMGNRNM